MTSIDVSLKTGVRHLAEISNQVEIYAKSLHVGKYSRISEDTVDGIVTQAHRMDRITRALGTLALIDEESGRSEHVDPRYLIEQAVRAADDEGRGVYVSITRDVRSVHVNPFSVTKSLAELVKNALVYSPAGSDVHIKVQKFSREGTTFTVLDRGIGIEESDMARITRPFFRGSRARAMHADGVGLGLVLVESVASAHDGSLTFDSTPGQGSEFRLTI